MFRRDRCQIAIALLALGAGVFAKPPPGAGAGFKPLYTRSLGPPPGVPAMSTITVPYVPKSPMFPKFVDPKSMISQKTDYLNTLFGGIGPVYPGSLPLEYSSGDMFASKDKRGIFGPVAGPFGPKFGPMASKFGPFGPFSASPGSGFDSSVADYSRRKRSSSTAPPPAYPGLGPIAEDAEAGKKEVSSSLEPQDGGFVPLEFLPGMYGPFGPPVVDPTMFIAKKSAFLDTLFKTLATTTPVPATTEAPAPKSTIVPPEFWLPTSFGPADYDSKVSTFLDKLFQSIILNKTASSTGETDPGKLMVKRSVDDLETIASAKDAIVESILQELTSLKGNMLATFNDLVTFQKFSMPKKPFKPFPPGMAADPTLPFQQKMLILSQVFDMLTDLERNVTKSVQEAMKSPTPDYESYSFYPYAGIPANTGYSSLNLTFLDAIRDKLSSIGSGKSIVARRQADEIEKSPGTPRTASSFWVSYPRDEVRRQVGDDYYDEGYEVGNGNHRVSGNSQHPRSVKMQMHQGYQSLPNGALESIQAGGGSVPGHQGGGVKLFNGEDEETWKKWLDWAQYMRESYREGRKHHHNDH